MSSPSARRQKIVIASLFISLLLLLSNSCLAATHEYSYELLDSPDGSTTYRLTVSVTETLYEYYSSQDHNLYSYDFSKFVTPDALKPIADDLWSIYSNEEDFANGALMILHQIPYVESEPQKYPIETIVENEGDCDLFSIIAASIMKAGGLDVVLLLLEYEDHMLVGVHLPESPKDARSQVYFYKHEEKKYYVAETTGGNWENGWRVGECSESLQSASAKIIPLENYEMSAPGQVSSSYTLPDSASIYMSLSTNFAVFQNSVEIRGSLSPSLAGETVTLYVSSLGSPLTMLATVVTDSTGQYCYTWYSPPGGIHSVRANWSGDDDYSGADSSTFRLVVVPSELLMIGVILIFFLVILLIVALATRGGKSEKQEIFEEWDFADYPEYF
ncbi:MAG: Ig-like domain-containing protein [Candidatus Bathyarchaeota archaeon]|nr:Ig-like domain-containing protein [Candidatus Bathyarchaeota archaeon]